MEIILHANRRIEDADPSLVPTTFKQVLQTVWPDHDVSNMADDSVVFSREIDGVGVNFEAYRSRISLSVRAVKRFRDQPTRRWVALHHIGNQRVRLDVAQLREKHADLIPLAKERQIERDENNRIVEVKRVALDEMYADANLVPDMTGKVHIRETHGSDTYSVTYVSDVNLTPGAAVEVAKVIQAALRGINLGL